jgi:BMFP domain-containing protein YqiC
MAQKKSTGKKASPRKRGSVKKVIHEVKEPLSLLQTLREEGMSNALTLLSMASGIASGAAKSFRAEAIRPQLGELISSLGFAMREDLERLQDRVGELEQRLSELEYAALRAEDGEE